MKMNCLVVGIGNLKNSKTKMENPRWWGPVKTLLNNIHEEHQRSMSDGIIGGSLGLRLFNALKAKGYLSEKALQEEQHHVDVMGGKKDGVINVLGMAVKIVSGKEQK